MSAAARYAETVRVPYVARILLVGGVARMAPSIEFIALVLFVRDLGDSYAIAGAVTAAYTVGFAVAAPLQGRLADSYGPTRVLWPLAIIHTAAMVALILAGLGDQSGAVLIVLGLVAGLAMPPTGAILRRALAQQGTSRRDLLPSLFALDSLCTEIIFMTGPMLTALIILVASPAAALVVACAMAILGVAGLILVPAIERDDSALRSGRLGALQSAGMRTLIGCVVPLGVAYGGFQVGIVAFADDVDASWSAPWLLALLSLGGAAGALVYGAYGHKLAGSKTLLWMACVLPVCFAPIVLATSVAQMAVLVIVGGALLTPIVAVTNQMVGDLAPADAVTEAYAWLFMGMLSGISLGLTVGGKLVDASSWHAGIVIAIGATLLIAVVVVCGRRNLAEIGWRPAAAKAT